MAASKKISGRPGPQVLSAFQSIRGSNKTESELRSHSTAVQSDQFVVRLRDGAASASPELPATMRSQNLPSGICDHAGMRAELSNSCGKTVAKGVAKTVAVLASKKRVPFIFKEKRGLEKVNGR